jgi:hypothetical protein
MAATGAGDLTLAFVLSKGACNPEWDGNRPLTGGPDQAAIEAIRAAGGDVSVSFGGWSGKKLGVSCHTPAALASAYQRVISAYALSAIDIDIEHTELSNAAARSRVIAALALVQAANPGIEISITIGSGEAGPEGAGRSLITMAAAAGFRPTAWTVMPFDFGVPAGTMGGASVRAVEGLAGLIASSYRVSAQAAYAMSGVSSMNGRTDERSETVSLADFEAILAFAQQRHLARLSFWSVNRDRACAGSITVSDECSGIAQLPFAFTDVLARYHG